VGSLMTRRTLRPAMVPASWMYGHNLDTETEVRKWFLIRSTQIRWGYQVGIRIFLS